VAKLEAIDRPPYAAPPEGVIPDPAEVPTLWAYENRAAPYLSFACTVEYEWFTGWVQVPLAQAEPTGVDLGGGTARTCQLVKLCASYGTKTVRYFAVRDGAQPTLPAPGGAAPTSPGDPANEVLVYAKVTPSVPELLENGLAYRYQVTGEYRYALLSPRTDATGFPVGSGPYTVTPAALHAMGPDLFSPTILG
jgi:hypothetical protein